MKKCALFEEQETCTICISYWGLANSKLLSILALSFENKINDICQGQLIGYFNEDIVWALALKQWLADVFL